MQKKLHERKIEIENIKAKIDKQNNKQQRITESFSKNKQTYQQLLEKTKEDEEAAANAIAQLDAANIEKRSQTLPEKILYAAMKAVMILLQKP